MKYYLQVREVSNELDAPLQSVGPLYVADRDEALSTLDTVRGDFSGMSYKAEFVTCRHEENMPCIAETLEEVNL